MKTIEERHKEILAELKKQTACSYVTAVSSLADCQGIKASDKEKLLKSLSSWFD